MICLPKELTDKFKIALKSGEINPDKLRNMTSEQRREFLKGIVGENAKEVNTLFESKLRLKDQQAGIIRWAKETAGLRPEARNDIIDKVNKLQDVLSPADEESFLKDLASSKIDADVTFEEAKKITDLAQKVNKAKSEMEAGGDRIAYGKAAVEFSNYIDELKNKPLPAKEFISEAIKHPMESAIKTAGFAKSLKASFDDSAIFRQGWKAMWTNPKEWSRNAVKSFKDIIDTFGNKPVMDEVRAEIVSRPNYDLMKKAKLATGTVEEAFPSTLPEKIPILGKAYKASETAYTAFLYRLRADIFDKYMDIAKKSGVDITDKAQLESIGKVINSLTGRGNLGKAENAGELLNNFFFSPRFLKSQVDVLTAHTLDRSITPFARKQAATNLLKTISGTAGLLGLIKAISPDSVETDPRSADFGKVKIGETRFDLTGGMAGVITLASRILSGATKSSTTGVISELGTGYGQKTALDVVSDFFGNKLSPAASVARDLLRGQTADMQKPTFGKEVTNLFVPLPVQNYFDIKDNKEAANVLMVMIADGLGISTQTYSQEADWMVSQSAKLNQFKEKVGEAKFKEANDKFNQEYKNWFETNSKTQKYKDLSEEDKKSLLTQKKDELTDKVLKTYGFKYKTDKKSMTLKKLFP